VSAVAAPESLVALPKDYTVGHSVPEDVIVDRLRLGYAATDPVAETAAAPRGRRACRAAVVRDSREDG
jgi:hypothetical protein